jgi:hypothetical protein
MVFFLKSGVVSSASTMMILSGVAQRGLVDSRVMFEGCRAGVLSGIMVELTAGAVSKH